MLARYCYRSKDQIDAEAVVPWRVSMITSAFVQVFLVAAMTRLTTR